MNINRQRAGQKGGIITLMKYGKSHFEEIGRQGGRPKRQQIALEAGNNHKGGGLPNLSSNNLKKLKELWEQKGRDFAANSSPQGGNRCLSWDR
ncbi:hypothetical protein ES703_98187 [subsurface metagenome]